jgi:hypothetical protein
MKSGTGPVRIPNLCLKSDPNLAGRLISPQVEILLRFFVGTYLGNGTYVDDLRVLAWCGSG